MKNPLKIQYIYKICLELIYYFTYFLPSSHPKLVFLSCRPFVVNTTFTTGLLVLTTKGLQERNTQVLDGMTVKNRYNNNSN